LATPVRQILRDLNHDVAILDLLTLRQHIRQALYDQQLMAGLIAALGALGLLLAAVGIYGLMAFLVGRRTQEIGIRLALGAQRHRIFSVVLKQALTLTAAGTVIGAIAAIAATRLLRTLLLGVAPTDVVAFAIAVAVLLLAAFMAAVAPAITASRVDPMVALRYE
jgi:ABC-type antimicrobial peptide transport system permease subunit